MNSMMTKSPPGWKVFLPVVFLFAAGAFFVSCYPGDTLTVAETDIIATFVRPDADFSTKQTFYRPDFIFDLDDMEMQGDAAALEVLDVIDENMEDLGYTKSDTLNADVRVLAFKNKSTWTGGSCYPAYYPYYWGWCYPVAYSYTTGSFLIVILDNSDQTTQQQALWVAGINGILDGTTASLTTRLHDGIHQAFDQSPYLGDGK